MGLYVYYGTTYLGCDSTIVWNVTQLSNSNDLDKTENILVFPNPAQEVVFIKIKAAIQPISIKVFDTLGKEWTELPIKGGENLYQIALPNISGMYNVVIQSEQGIYTKSIFKI
jgi:hypothetical protein